MDTSAAVAIKPKFVTLPHSLSQHPIAYTVTDIDVPAWSCVNGDGDSNGKGDDDDNGKDGGIDDIFMVFVNGLGTTQTVWQPTIESLKNEIKKTKSSGSGSDSTGFGDQTRYGEDGSTPTTTAASTTSAATTTPADEQIKKIAMNKNKRSRKLKMITYDRQGQGLSQPVDAPPPEPHDILTSVEELHDVIEMFKPSRGLFLELSDTKASTSSSDDPTTKEQEEEEEKEKEDDEKSTSRTVHQRTTTEEGRSKADIGVKTFLIAHSIGAPLSRLFCDKYPESISALLILDSNMATTDFVSLFPDPDSSSFEPEKDLPPDTTVEQLRWTRQNYRTLLHPDAPNPENMIRSNLKDLLPHADRPVLYAEQSFPTKSNKENKKKKELILLTVVSHDAQTLAEQSLGISTRGLTLRYLVPVWQRYHLDLLRVGRSTLSGTSDATTLSGLDHGHGHDHGHDHNDDDDDDEKSGNTGQDGEGSAAKIIVAPGAGHFVQRDNPRCVAFEICNIIRRL